MARGSQNNRIDDLVARLLAGDPLAAARSISLIERDDADVPALLEAIHGRRDVVAYRVGITGPPGAGKSTLVNELAAAIRKRGKSVGILAIDPTSPFSGGALLGDRVRMQTAAQDDGVFIRSMATRGSSGGLSRNALDACEVLNALGRDLILLETVGVGQLEVDIVAAADSTVVVLHPESGDSVQTMKAGLMEIGDLFVINKADRPGADRLGDHLQSGLELKQELNAKLWVPTVTMTEAIHGNGIEELLDRIEAHRAFQEANNLLPARRRARLVGKLEQVVQARIDARIWNTEGKKRLDALVKQIELGHETPYSAADKLVAGALASDA